MTTPFRFSQFCRAPIDDLNSSGAVRVLINSLVLAGWMVDRLRVELSSDEPDDHVINAMLVAIMPMYINWLDQVARFCQREDPLEGCGGDIHFHSYTFRTGRFDTIAHFKRKIEAIEFDGLKFNSLCNRIEHESPWVGRVMDCEVAMRRDVHAGGGSFIQDVVYEAFRACEHIARYLARLYDVTNFIIPKL